jgi:hypothetical protein
MMLFVVILLVIFVVVPGVIFFKMEIGITNDRLQWLEERLTKLEKDAVKITFAPPFTTGDDKVTVHPDVKVTPPPKKRKPKSVKDWEDNFDLGGHE